MALRYLVAKMRAPAAAALRLPAVSRGLTAPRSQPFSATARQGDEDRAMNATRKEYEFYRSYLESVENDLNVLRVFTERVERANRYLSLSFKFLLLPVCVLSVALKALK